MNALSGATSDGFRTTVQPAASAGATQRDLVERIVPRRDGRDDAHGLAHHQRIADLRLEFERLGEFGVCLPVVDRRADLDRARQLDRHPDLAGDRWASSSLRVCRRSTILRR
jgi:hypothetical protein